MLPLEARSERKWQSLFKTFMRKLKKELISACFDFVEQRKGRIRAAITDLEEALKLETKCSAGDKYETGRAMLHLEFEKLALQMQEYQKLQKTLSFIDPNTKSDKVAFGSVVKTETANYFISIPAGKLEIDQESFFAVGTASPVAQTLMHKKETDGFILNGNSGIILKIE